MNRTRLTSLLPKLLLVIATVAIGVVVGRATQPDNAESANDQVAAAAPTIEGIVQPVDVLAPVAVGANPPPSPADGDATLGLGEIVGSETVVVPTPLADGASPEIPADVPGDLSQPSPVAPESPLDDITSFDPSLAEGVTPIDVALDELALEPTDSDDGSPDDFGVRPYVDPCAPPAGGGAPSDCPEGARSTVLPIVAAEAAYVTVRQVGAATASNPSCGATAPAASGGALLEVRTNAPGSLRITVVDIAGRGGSVGMVETSTDPADAAAWADMVARGVDPDAISSLIVHCVALDDLPANASLVALARFTRADDGARAYALKEILTTPTPLRPPTIVVPVGANRLLVSVAHQRGQRASLDAWVSADGRASCDPPERFHQLWADTVSTGVADVNALRARGYDDTYRLRTTAVFWVPEGRAINVCARTFDNSGPSFRTTQPVQRDATVVHTPDMVVPVVSVDSIVTNANVVGADMRVTLSWARGSACGYFAGRFNESNRIDPPEYDNDCDGGAAGAAANQGSNVVVVTGLRTPAMRDTVETSAVLPVRARACTGGDEEGFGATCPTLPTEWYRVPLATVPVRTGICSPGLFETTCEPPTRDTVAGTVVLRVDWVAGGVSGRAGWLVEPIVAAGRSTELPPTPQLDLTGNAEASGEGARQTVNFNLLADRPVNWTLTVPEGTCRRDDAAEPVWRSSAASPQFTVRADGFCTGVWVQFIVTLTDPATGASSTYGQWPSAWHGGYLYLPPSTRPLTVQVGIGQPDGFYDLWTPTDVYVQIERPESTQFVTPWGARYDFPTPLPTDPALRCDQSYRPYPGVYGWSREGYGVATQVPDEIRIRVTVELTQAEGSVDRCRATGYRSTVVLETTISEADLAAARDGIRLTAPDDAAFPVEVVVRLDG